jgi:hypothetical protein
MPDTVSIACVREHATATNQAHEVRIRRLTAQFWCGSQQVPADHSVDVEDGLVRERHETIPPRDEMIVFLSYKKKRSTRSTHKIVAQFTQRFLGEGRETTDGT